MNTNKTFCKIATGMSLPYVKSNLHYETCFMHVAIDFTKLISIHMLVKNSVVTSLVSQQP